MLHLKIVTLRHESFVVLSFFMTIWEVGRCDLIDMLRISFMHIKSRYRQRGEISSNKLAPQLAENL